jgi:hypothetical protein
MHLKQPPEIIIPMLPMMPTFPGEIVALKNDTWICHGCDEEVAAGKRRCRCGCWRDGVRGPTKKKPEVKNAPNYKKAATSKAGRKPKHGLPLNVECSGGLVVAADGLNIEGTVPTSSPLTGGNSIIDEDPTDNDSIQTLSTAARQRESDLDVVVLLNQQDQIEKGDGGDSDIEGDGEDVAMSFVESMVEVEFERENQEGYIIEREVECDDNTAVEGATFITNENSPQLWGAPPNWIPPQVPPNWKRTTINSAWGEPTFDKVDNPAGWSAYTYQPVFNKEKKQYLYHAMQAEIPISDPPARGAIPAENTTKVLAFRTNQFLRCLNRLSHFQKLRATKILERAKKGGSKKKRPQNSSCRMRRRNSFVRSFF